MNVGCGRSSHLVVVAKQNMRVDLWTPYPQPPLKGHNKAKVKEQDQKQLQKQKMYCLNTESKRGLSELEVFPAGTDITKHLSLRDTL
jgi:hypothetical protein